MKSHNFNSRVMSREDVELAIEWAAMEGWNPGLDDAQCFYNADPNGLFQALTANVPDSSPVFLDIPEVNNRAVDLVIKYNMIRSFETARMYTGSFPDLPLNRIYGVTSFELG